MRGKEGEEEEKEEEEEERERGEREKETRSRRNTDEMPGCGHSYGDRADILSRQHAQMGQKNRFSIDRAQNALLWARGDLGDSNRPKTKLIGPILMKL